MVANGDKNGISIFAIGKDSSDNDSMPSLEDYNDSDNDDDESCLAALMAHDNKLDKDSWGSHLKNDLDNSDVPYGDMVRDSRYFIDNESREEPTVATDTYNIDNIERIVETDSERLHFPTTDSNKDSIALILDPYPEVYCLMDHVLQH